MSRPTVLRLRHVLGWLAVVVVTAVVTTLIVTSVGRDVTDSVAGGAIPLPPAPAGAAMPTAPAAPGTGDLESGEDRSAPAGPGSGASSPPGAAAGAGPAAPTGDLEGGTDAADASGDAAGQAGSRGGGARDAQTGVGSGATAAGTTPSGGTATRTYSTPGGAAVVGCRGGQPYARAVTPRYGWSFETETETGELDVTFTQPGQEYPLHVMCRGSQPVLTEGYGSGHH